METPVKALSPESPPTDPSSHLRALQYSLTAGVWVAAQISTGWWAYAVGTLNATRPRAPTSSVVVDDFAGTGVIRVWLIVATMAHTALFTGLLVFSGAFGDAGSDEPSWVESLSLAVAMNVTAITAMCAVAIAYAWTVTTLPALGPVLLISAPQLSKLELQHAAMCTTILFCGLVAGWVNTTQTQARRIVKRELADAGRVDKHD